jgi:multisubunit Na+/H+ antiporter MnhF subunit
MNIWQIAALALVLTMIPAAAVIAKARTMDCLVALEFTTSSGVLALMLVAEGIRRPSFLDIPLTLALLSYPASLLFAHFYERWL